MSDHVVAGNEMIDPPALRPGVELVGDRQYMRKPNGALMPIEGIKEFDLLEDEVVRDLFDRAQALSNKMASEKAAFLAEVDALVALGAERYGVSVAGEKGNLTLKSYDGTRSVQVQRAKTVTLSSVQLVAAKALIEKCLKRWTEDSCDDLRTFVANAFRVDSRGEYSKSSLLGLLSHNSKDPDWLLAMDAIRDSIDEDFSGRYLRFYARETLSGPKIGLRLDMATV